MNSKDKTIEAMLELLQQYKDDEHIPQIEYCPPCRIHYTAEHPMECSSCPHANKARAMGCVKMATYKMVLDKDNKRPRIEYLKLAISAMERIIIAVETGSSTGSARRPRKPPAAPDPATMIL